MSQKANTETVETNFEKFADKAGWDTSELAEHVYEVYGESGDDDDLVGDMFEGETETQSENTGAKLETMEHGEKVQLASKAVDMGILNEYPGNSHEALNEALSGKVQDIVGGESETESESEDYPVPYADTDSPNDPKSYENPEAIMSKDEIRNHEAWDGSTELNKLMHYQGKNGLCSECGLWAAMAGETCNKCESETTESGGITVAEVQETFGVNPEMARKAIQKVEKGLFGSVKGAVDSLEN